MEKNSRTEMLPGKRDFYRCCKARRSPHTRKQRIPAAISKLRSAFFTGYKNKIARTISLSTSKACNFTHPPRTGDAYAREYSYYVGTS